MDRQKTKAVFDKIDAIFVASSWVTTWPDKLCEYLAEWLYGDAGIGTQDWDRKWRLKVIGAVLTFLWVVGAGSCIVVAIVAFFAVGMG